MLGFALGMSIGLNPAATGGTPTPSAPMTAIAADGWRATVTSPTDLSLAPTTVSRQGYDAAGGATTHSETMWLTKRVRQAYPNQASLTANDQAMSDYIYSTDTIAGVTNSSAEVSPKPVANWIMPHRLVVGNSLMLEVAAFHRNARAGKQVACVIFRATDGTNTVTATVSAPAISGRTGDRNPVISYKATLDITSLNAGLITCNAIVYPHIGSSGSRLDSADQSAGREFSPRYFLKNTGTKTKYVVETAANGGNDTTGAGSTVQATAEATPFATVLAALNKAHADLGGTSGIDMAEIQIGNDGGTPFVLGAPASTRTQKVAALTITRKPGVSRANARVSFGAAAFRARFGGSLASPLTTGAIRFADVGLVRTGTSNIQGEAASQLEIIFDDVDFDNGSNNATWLSNSHDYFYGATITNLSGASAFGAGTYEHRMVRGVSLQPSFAAGGTSIESWCVIGCSINNPFLARGTRTRSGGIVSFNKFSEPPTSANLLVVGFDEDVTDFAFVQNQCEYVSTTTGTMLTVSADAATGNTSHVIIHNNTFAGAFIAGRQNLFYDDGGTARTNKLQSVKGNIFVQINTKSDVFMTNGARTGNFAFENGVGCAGNFSQFIDADSGGIGSAFAQDYPGLTASIGTSATVRNSAGFTTYAGTTYNGSYTAGAGGGDYTLAGGSTAIGILATAVLSHNLAGSTRPSSNDNAGAY